MNNKVRVRFAPSPTGPLHIGGVRTALFNYLFAKKHGGVFILRVEDTDSKREVSGSVDYIFDCLNWLGIPVDESPKNEGAHGPYTQSKRSHLYKKYVDMLVDSGHAYYAFDTSEELDKMRTDLSAAGIKSAGYTGTVRDRMKNSLSMSSIDVKAKIDAGDPYVVRFKMPRGEDVRFKDEIRGWVVFNTKDLDDKVIWKSSDGLPTYHMANVIDDHLMEITHVIRGEEWVSSTPLHVLMYNAFGWEHPTFAHLPLILGPDSKKLGKRNKYGIPVFPLDWTYTDPEGEVVDIKGFCEAGYEPDAFINYLALLGWNPGGNVEHMTMDEMISSFSLERVNSAGAMFDLKKLDSFNAHYVRSRSSDWVLSKMSIPDDFRSELSDDKLSMIAKMATERVVFAKDLTDSMTYLWNTPDLSGEIKPKNVDEFERVMKIFVADDFMSDFDDYDWTVEHIRMELDSITANIGTAVGKIMPMLRVALTGGVPGPQLPEIMYIIGMKETKNRIDALLDKLKELA
jgi:glutamyl-tRNA synthetase